MVESEITEPIALCTSFTKRGGHRLDAEVLVERPAFGCLDCGRGKWPAASRRGAASQPEVR